MEPLRTGREFDYRQSRQPLKDRRRRVRHRVSLPAIARQHGSANVAPSDIGSIVDISEEGVRIHTPLPLAQGTNVALELDLPESWKSVQATGTVIWSNGVDHIGIHLAKLSTEDLTALKQWMFLNVLVSCASLQGETWQSSQVPYQVSSPAQTLPVAEPVAENYQPPFREYTSTLAALVAVRREVEALGPNLDAALQLLAERAQAFTPATGAAIALQHVSNAEEELIPALHPQLAEFVCRASAGPDAPPKGALLQAGSGFSGECVRTGKLLVCGDAELDQRVDRESCRDLGIRSMVAVPIRNGASIIGLLEVFSSQPNVFGMVDNGTLQQLADTATAAISRSAPLPVVAPDRTRPEKLLHPQQPLFTTLPSAQAEPHARRQRTALIAAVVVGLAILGWLLWPWVRSYVLDRAPMRAAVPASTRSQLQKTGSVDRDSMEGLRRLAEQGDASAQFAIGARYATADGVPQDYGEAISWFEMAAEQGHVISQATLGAYYWAGRGIPQDLSKAYFWSVLAGAGGDQASKYRIEVLSSRLTRAQIADAQKQADAWRKQHSAVSSQLLPAH